MLCWVRPHEKVDLINAVNGEFPIDFAKNYEDFQSQIEEDDYLIFSCCKARFGLKKLQQLVRAFPNCIFHLYQIKETDLFTSTESLLMFEPNVIEGQYGATELVDNFYGKIKDLWKKRLNDPIIVNWS